MKEQRTHNALRLVLAVAATMMLWSPKAAAQQKVEFGDSMFVTTMAPVVVTPNGEDPALYILGPRT